MVLKSFIAYAALAGGFVQASVVLLRAAHADQFLGRDGFHLVLLVRNGEAGSA
jgi:hypothetical protein